MNKFKEWLSDNLRYFILGTAVIAVIFILFFGYKLLGNMLKNDDGSKKQTEEIKPGTKNGTEDKNKTEKQSDTEKQKTETNKSTEKSTEKTTGKSTEKSTEKTGESTKSSESVNGEDSTNNGAQSNIQTETTAQSQVPQTDAPSQTEAAAASVPKTIYMNAAAYIREAPSYDGAILDTLQAGQAVTFLEDVGGWYKVEANGFIGYVGARFFS